MERDLSEFLDKIDAAEAENLESVYLYDKAYDEGFADGYKQAVDEFASELENHSINADIGKGDEVKMEWVSPVTRIKEVAEQMKGGAE